MNQTDRITPAALAEQTDTITAQLCDQMQSDGMTPTLAARVATWAAAGGGYNRQEMIDRAAYFVRLIVERIANARHPRAQAEAFRIAFGFHRGAADSIREAARRVRMSRPGLQKQANAIRAELHLPKGNAFAGSGRSGAPQLKGGWGSGRQTREGGMVGAGVGRRAGARSAKADAGLAGLRVLPKTSVCR